MPRILCSGDSGWCHSRLNSLTPEETLALETTTLVQRATGVRQHFSDGMFEQTHCGIMSFSK